MAVGYVDTSYLVAVAFREPGHAALRSRLFKLARVFSSTLMEAEFLAVARREGVSADVGAFLRNISWIHPGRRLTPEISRVLNLGYLRGADLYHLATALCLFPSPKGVPFLTLDREQSRLAVKLGFRAQPVGKT